MPPSPEFDDNSKPEEPVEEEKSSPAVEPIPQPQQSPDPDSSPDQKVQEDDSEQILQPVLQPIEVEEPVLNQSVASMISAIVEQDRIRAFEASIAHRCTPTQRASPVRICAPAGDDVAQRAALVAYEDTFSDVFRHLSATSSSFRRDMDMVESLLQKQEELASIVPADEFEAALLAQERRDINDEIFRIDRKYQQVNLLKLIPIGINVVKKLWEAVKRKK